MNAEQLLEQILHRLEAGEFITSRRHKRRMRTVSVTSAGKEVEFGLPNLKGVAAWRFILLNEATAPSGTDTRAYFSINDERDKTAVLADLVAGNGLYCVPGQAYEEEIAEDVGGEQPVIVTLQGVQVTAGPTYAGAAVKVTLCAIPLVRAKRD
jgi:hypothetical protein